MPVIATAGHVDHGKSSLVRAMTGTDPDRHEEEQRRGMSIDLGFAHVSAPDGTVLSFVDVPGHVDFVRTMISGVNAVSCVLFVVDAAEGWMPQSAEHMGIVTGLGIHHGVLAVTKCDKVDDDAVRACIDDIVRRTPRMRWSARIATSAVTGRGVGELVSALAAAARGASTAPDPLGRVRLFVDRSFSVRGAGTVVTGTLEGAQLAAGAVLTLVRDGRDVRVRRVQSLGEEVTAVAPGSRCAVNIPDIDADAVERGDVLVEDGRWHVTDVFDASVELLEGTAARVTTRGGYVLHFGSSHQAAHLRLAVPGPLAAGQTAHARIRFRSPLPLTPGDRFVVRDTASGTTVLGGTVLDVDPRGSVASAANGASAVERLARRGWIPLDEARRLTGAPLGATVPGWWAGEHAFDGTVRRMRMLLDGGPVDLATLTEVERAVVAALSGVTVERGTAHTAARDPLLGHPYAIRFRGAPLDGGSTAGLDRDVIRRLVQAGIILEHDAIAFHTDTLAALVPALERLWAAHPGGFLIRDLAGALAISRKWAVPLAECLDRKGLTRRSGDVRLPGRALR
jgi:selenocysteine-specific elongation factor